MALQLTSSFAVVDPRFRKLALPYIHVEKLYTGCRWAEGPAWFAAGRYLVWSDIPNDRTLRWDETDGSVSVFRQPALYSNGHTVDHEGRLVSCEHRSRCVSRTEFDGSRTVLADRHDGKRFNSPNDVVVKSDGSVWFSDPSYGIDTDYEGDAAKSEIGACNVYRIDRADGRVTVVARDFVQPNGLAFSPDESLLYIVDSGLTHGADGPHHVRRFKVSADGRSIAGGEVLGDPVLQESHIVVEIVAFVKIDDRDRWLRHRLEVAVAALGETHEGVEVVGVLECLRAEHGEIDAGAERLALAAYQDRAGRLVDGRPLGGLAELAEHHVVDGVALVGPVQRDGADAAV